ncbi:MAG: extracellular solute-binding protein [Rhizobiaceae bacterium]
MKKENKNAINASRRTFLKTSAYGVAGAFSARMFAGPAFAAPGGELQIMAWEGYDLNKELAAWREATGVSVQTTTMTTQEDVHTKFLAGNPPPIDLAEYNQAYADLYAKELGIIRPLDPAAIPNYNAENMFDVFYEQPAWASEGKLWGAPYVWGINSILYNPALMDKPTSYTDLLDPSLKGKIAIWDETTSFWPITSRLGGFGEKFPNLSKEEMKASFAEMTKYRDQARLIALNMGEMLNFFASGEIAAVLCADPAIIPQARELGVDLQMAIPEEGPIVWVDAWFIPISSDNVETATAFINQSLDPQVQAQIAMAVQQAPVSKKALEFMDAAALERIDYDSIGQIFSAGLPGIPPAEGSDTVAGYGDWLEAWQAYKAGQ